MIFSVKCLYGGQTSVIVDFEGDILLSVETDDGDVYLTPCQARDLADALIESAAKVEEAAE